MTEETKRERVPRAQDPSYVINPQTGRFVKRGTKKYNQLLYDGILEQTRENKTIIARGTHEELTKLKKQLEDNNVLKLDGEELRIFQGMLIKARKKMSRREVISHTKRHACDSAIEHRELFNSKLTDQQLADLLMKVLDARILGAPVNLQADYNAMLKLNQRAQPPPLPKDPPPSLSPISGGHRGGGTPSGRSSVQSPIPGGHRGGGTPSPPSPKKRRGRPRKRFITIPPPDTTTDVGETTAFESETEFSD